MRTCVLYAKQDIRLEEREIPQPQAGQVLIQFGYGGICGSDMHYYFKGANGDFVVKHPFVLGHEVSGTVVEVGPGVTTLKPGDRVAANPNLPCGKCLYCRQGRENICPNVRFWGSASTMPHTDGAYQEYVLAEARQCCLFPPHFDLGIAAMAEPLAIGLHSANRAGSLMGKSVLVAGAGTIGTLILLVARAMGAKTVAITDILAERLNRARQCGADLTVNMNQDSAETQALSKGEMPFDVTFEASGSLQALNMAIMATLKGGTIVQVGFLPSGEVGVLANKIMAKELALVGSFRSGMAFDWAVEYLASGRINVKPLITHQFAADRIDDAFATAADGRQSTKVQIFFE
ncbi:MAG: L-idonate 5-dehydrogenase [Anaerolineae bacterium]|nr:L-idonate 5-dehydrogenase [Anaerolineae bacterium]